MTDLSVLRAKYALSPAALTPSLNRRQINQALKDEEAVNATFIGQERARDE